MNEYEAKPNIDNSTIGENVNLSSFTCITDSKITSSSSIYRGAKVIKSNMGYKSFVGDGSKLDNGVLDDYARIGRYNHIYFTHLGRHTYTGQDTVIMHTHIGSFTSIAWGVTIGAAEHDFSRLTSHTFLYNPYDELNNETIYYDRFKEKCEIGNDVWIGANSTILRGVSIGDGAVIGANSVVTKDVPPYAIVIGNPAKVVRFRFEKHIIEKLLKLKWWNFEDEFIRKNCDLFSREPDNRVLEDIEKLRYR